MRMRVPCMAVIMSSSFIGDYYTTIPLLFLFFGNKKEGDVILKVGGNPMIHPANYLEAKRRLRDLIAAAVRGETVLIQKDQTIIQLVPVNHPKPRPKFGSAKGLVHIADDFDAPLPDFEEYTR